MSTKRGWLQALVLAIAVLAVPGLALAQESGMCTVPDEKDIERAVEKKSYSPVGGRALSFRLDQSDVTDEPSSGNSNSPGEDDAGWSFQLAPYVWMASVKADVAIGPFEFSGEEDFIDLVKKLDVGAMLHFEGKESWRRKKGGRGQSCKGKSECRRCFKEGCRCQESRSGQGGEGKIR